MNTNYAVLLLFSIPGALLATTAHEFIRAAVSSHFGDTLPKNNGRLTLNPIRHFEPIGFLLLLATGGFGWGKPVETSALYYKNRKRDALLTAILPTVGNLVIALIALMLYKICVNMNMPFLLLFLFSTARYNVALAVFNLLPVVPMDCVKVLSVVMPANQYFQYMQYEKVIQIGFFILLIMGFFGNFFQYLIQLILQCLEMLLFFL
ncbi:MAG: site-2 protease family protein [Epulopiscium sp.]|nr:site-2 protease family protein [Candidatus Epulonipiscium sp.]